MYNVFVSTLSLNEVILKLFCADHMKYLVENGNFVKFKVPAAAFHIFIILILKSVVNTNCVVCHSSFY